MDDSVPLLDYDCITNQPRQKNDGRFECPCVSSSGQKCKRSVRKLWKHIRKGHSKGGRFFYVSTKGELIY